MTTSLREIVLSVRYGDAALVGESAGYLVLGVADLFSEMPRAASLDAVYVTDDGSVVVDASPCTFQESEASLRRMLSLLLQLVRTPCRNLDRVAERQETRGLSGLVAELESALVPVNRKAARRSLARLVREAKKASARMGVLASVEPVPPVSKTSELVSQTTSSPTLTSQPEYAELSAAPAAVALPFAATLPEVQFEGAVEDFVQVEAEEVFSDLPTSVPPFAASLESRLSIQLQAPTPIQPPTAEVIAEARRVPLWTQNSLRPSSPPVTGVQITGSRAGTESHGGSRDLRTLEFLAREYAFLTPAVSAMTEPLESESEPALPVQVYSEDLDPLDEAPTQIFSGVIEVEAVTTVPPTAMRAAPGKVFESPVRPSNTRSRPPIADDVPLVPGSTELIVRRPSDIQELLNRMPVSNQPDDEIYAGLKMLSRVELSPLAPPVGADWMLNKIKAS